MTLTEPTPARGELLALLLPGLALLGSELVGVGCNNKAERLALLVLGCVPFVPLVSGGATSGGPKPLDGEADKPLGGGVAIGGVVCAVWLNGGSALGPVRPGSRRTTSLA